MVVNELVTKFTFEGTTEPIHDYNASFNKALGLLAKGIGIATAAAGAFGLFVNSTLASADAQAQLANSTNIAIGTIQELEFAASVSGSSAEALQGSILGLSEKIGEAAAQGEANFDRLGIKVKKADGSIKNAAEVFDDLREKFQDLSDAERINYAQKLGIDKSLVQLLSRSGDEMDALREKASALGTVTQDQANDIMEYNDSITILKFGLGALQKDIAIGFAPQLKELAEIFTDFLIANKDLISKGISRLIEIIGSMLRAIFNVGSAFIKAIDNTIGLENAMILLGAAVIFFNRALLLSPITWIIAGIVGLIAIIDDLIVGFRGGESVIFDFFDSMSKYALDAVDIIVNAFESVMEVIDAVIKGIEWANNAVAGVIADIGIGTVEVINDAANFLGFGNESAPTTNTNSVNVQKIEVNSSDPVRAGEEVQKQLSNMFNNAKSQSNRGGR